MNAFEAQRITSQAIEKKINKLAYEALEKEKERGHLVSQAIQEAPSHFQAISLRIEEEAKKGNKELRVWYNEKSEKFKYEAIAELAQKHGFKTRFHSEEIDHGDSAAPCRVDHYYLTISW